MWEAHQRMGFFGWTPDGAGPLQMRWQARVDLERARRQVADITQRWWAMMAWDAPPFSGGVLDAWPARLADGLAVCKSEWAAIQAALKAEAEQGKVPHG